MLINLRNALMAGKRLPYDAEVEYLEGTGTQYIYLDSYIDGFDGMVLPRDSNAQGIVGVWNGGSRSDTIKYTGTQSRGWVVTNGDNTNVVYSYDTSHTMRRVVVDGTSVTIGSSSFAMGAKWSVYFNSYTKGWCLFGCYNTNNNTCTPLSGYVGACKLYYRGALKFDFIPVRKGTVGYLYDRVSGKLFGNAGTGDFVLGPDVVPVEWLESHGTEYIDTGFKASNSTRVAVDFELTSSIANRWILGARNGPATAADKFALFLGTNSSYAMIGSAMGEFSGANIKTGRHLLDMSLAGGVVVDSQIVATYSASEQAEVFSGAYGVVLFNLWNGSLNNPFIGKYYVCKFWDNGDPVRKFLPVRVGTEGAMMDVLTRRIYRNAGTGAFTYGNDLKYPIPAE